MSADLLGRDPKGLGATGDRKRAGFQEMENFFTGPPDIPGSHGD
jgi:hypothetical protein